MTTFAGRGFVVILMSVLVGACSSGRPSGQPPPVGGGGASRGGAGGDVGSDGNGGDVATGGTGGDVGGGGSGGGAVGDGTGGSAWLTLAQVPPALAAPAGATIKAHAHAVGAQIYTCTGSAAGGDAGATTYAWTFKAPEAKLFDATGVQFGTHGAGPSWTSSDGSVVVGAKVAQVDAPAAGAIPWLLLRISSTSGVGLFSDVTFVQRLNTAGGAAPATGCDSTTAGMDVPVAYAADYYFYVGGSGAAWLTPPANLPEALALPGSVVLAFHDHAVGAQVYVCSATSHAWALQGPDATLVDVGFAPVGTETTAWSGLSWTSADGSGLVAKELAEAEAPHPDAVPWMMLKEFMVSGTGEFTNVSIVLRVNTAGGQAPASGCDATTPGAEARVAYSADDYFFKDFGT